MTGVFEPFPSTKILNLPQVLVHIMYGKYESLRKAATQVSEVHHHQKLSAGARRHTAADENITYQRELSSVW